MSSPASHFFSTFSKFSRHLPLNAAVLLKFEASFFTNTAEDICGYARQAMAIDSGNMDDGP